MSQPIRDQGSYLGFLIGKKTQAWYRTLRSCCLSSFVEFLSVVAEKKSKMYQSIRGQGGHNGFLIGPKTPNLVQDVEILLPVKFGWIPFSGADIKSKLSQANQRPGRPSLFPDRRKKIKCGRGRWDFVFCQVSLNSFQRLQRRSQNFLGQSEHRAVILNSDRPEKHKCGLFEILLPIMFCWILSSVAKKKLKMSQPIRDRAAILVFRSARET